MLESLYIESFIRSRLAGDATFTGALGSTTRMHRQREPQGGAYPVLVYRLVDPEDVNTANKQVRLIVRCTYEIVVKSKGHPEAPAVAAANRMDELFGNVRRVSYTAGGETLSFNSWREAVRHTHEQSRTEPDVFFIGNGGFYTFEAFTAE